IFIGHSHDFVDRKIDPLPAIAGSEVIRIWLDQFSANLIVNRIAVLGGLTLGEINSRVIAAIKRYPREVSFKRNENLEPVLGVIDRKNPPAVPLRSRILFGRH